MKTIKYFIEFDYCENGMCSPMEISKKEFMIQLKFLRKQIDITEFYDTPITESEAIVRETESTVENTYVFLSGCARTFLTVCKCKPGYRFKRESEKR